MSAGQYCDECGEQLVVGKRFCASCGSPVPGTPTTGAAPATLRYVDREYDNWKLRDADIRSMRQSHWSVVGQEQLSGHRWRVRYSTGAPAGQAQLPAQLYFVPKRGVPTIAKIALVLGGLLFAGSIFASMGGNSASGSGPTFGQPTPTPPSANAAVYLDPRVLAANPSGYTGRNIYLQGKALNVTQKPGYTWVQMMAQPEGKSDTESIVVEMPFLATDLIKGECFRIYGIAHGTQEVTRTLTGAKDNVPLVNGYQYASSGADKYGSCTSPSATR